MSEVYDTVCPSCGAIHPKQGEIRHEQTQDAV